MTLQIFVDPTPPTSHDVMDELSRQFKSLNKDTIEVLTVKSKPPAGALAAPDAEITSFIIKYAPLGIAAVKALFDIIKEVIKSKGGPKDPPKVVVVISNYPERRIILPANKEDERKFLEIASKGEEGKK